MDTRTRITNRIEHCREQIIKHISVEISRCIYVKNPSPMSDIGKLSIAGGVAIQKLNLLLESCGDDEVLWENLANYFDNNFTKHKMTVGEAITKLNEPPLKVIENEYN